MDFKYGNPKTVKDDSEILVNKIIENEFINKKRGISKDELLYMFYSIRDFFDVNKLDTELLYGFLFDGDIIYKQYKANSYFKFIFSILGEDYSSYYDFYKESLKNKSSFINIVNNNDYVKKFWSEMIYVLLWFCSIHWLNIDNIFYHNDDTNKNDFETCYFMTLNKLSKSDNNIYYRGQSNYKWELSPSFIRDYYPYNKKGCIIDKNELFKLYSKTDLIKKYNYTLCNKPINTPEDIDFAFLALMQHAVEYSPFIDLTSDPGVAYKFALKKNKPNSYLNIDSSIFILHINKGVSMPENFNENSYPLCIKYLNDKIKLGRIIKLVDSLGNKKILDFTSLSKTVATLTPKFVIINKATNDRMKYQKGSFLYFYDYVSVNGKICTLFNKDLTILKHRIPTSSKNNVLNKVEELCPYLKIGYMMDSYQVFND